MIRRWILRLKSSTSRWQPNRSPNPPAKPSRGFVAVPLVASDKGWEVWFFVTLALTAIGLVFLTRSGN
jgi:hypothetical protein